MLSNGVQVSNGSDTGGRGDNGVIRAWLLAPSSHQGLEQKCLNIFHARPSWKPEYKIIAAEVIFVRVHLLLKTGQTEITCITCISSRVHCDCSDMHLGVFV